MKKPVILKIGTSVIAGERGLLRRRAAALAREVARWRDLGARAILVTSGAIACGASSLGLLKRPRDLRMKQACAAIGQSGLMRLYEEEFSKKGLAVAQMLLTREDLMTPSRTRNARQTILTLLSHRVVPIINENDTVATEEIRMGDNDTLAAMLAVKVDARALIILTDVLGLFSRDPRHASRRDLVREVFRITPALTKMARYASGDLGSGGMLSKIQAARLAVSHGVRVVVASGVRLSPIADILSGEAPCTRFLPGRNSL